MIGNTLTLGEHLTLPVEERVVRLVAAMTGIEREKIVPRARLFHDLRVSGDDAVELLIALAQEFGVDLSGVDVTNYFPDEARSSVLHQILFWRGARKAFAALTVGDLIAAVEAKSLATVLANRAFAE